MAFIRLNIDIAETEPPSEFRIFAFGPVKTVKGDFVFDEEAARLVIEAAARWGNRFSIDYEHQAVIGSGPAPAAAWFDLELRDDGLWAVNVEWTDRAAEFLRQREYRYFSPAFDFDPKTRRITELVNVALTNLPATREMQPLVAKRSADRRTAAIAAAMSFGEIWAGLSKEISRIVGGDAWLVEVYDDSVIFERDGKLWLIGYRLDGERVVLDGLAQEVKRVFVPVQAPAGPAMFRKGSKMGGNSLFVALGLAESASEGEALAVLSRMQQFQREVLALAGKDSPAEALGILNAWKASHDQVVELSQKLSQLEAEQLGREVDDLVAGAKSAGKIAPTQEQWAKDLGRKDLAALKAFLEAAVPQVPATPEHQPPSGGMTPGAITLSAVEREVVRQLGVPDDQFLARKAALAAQ